MIKKGAYVVVAAMLTMGLAACNNNANNDINDRNGDRFGMDTTNRDNDILDVRNGKNNDIDFDNPFTKDNARDRDMDLNLFNDKHKNRDNDNMISAYQTNLNSDQYPHTRAILIRDAKYQYIPMNQDQGLWFQSGALQQSQPFIQQQNPSVKPPAQQPRPQQQQTQPAQPQQIQRAPQQVHPQNALPPQQSQPAKPAPKPAQPSQQKPAQTQTNASTTGSISQFAQQVIDLTNEQRRKNGLPALKADAKLSSVAQKKADDMQQNNYFSHTSPTYGSPFDMMRDFGVTYKSAGENIAQGQRTPQEVVTAWMNSEGHRKNILSANYTHIGVGFETTGKHWSQMFIGK